MFKKFAPAAVTVGVLALVGGVVVGPKLVGQDEPQPARVEMVQPAAQVEPAPSATPTATPTKAAPVKATPKPTKKATPVKKKASTTVSEPQQQTQRQAVAPEPAPQMTAPIGPPVARGGNGPGQVCSPTECTPITQ